MKKFLSLLLAMSLAVSGNISNSVEAKESTKRIQQQSKWYGDLDADGSVTLKDAQSILKGALKIISLSETEKKICDLDQSGDVNLHDAQTALKTALKIVGLVPMVVETGIQVEGINEYGSIITNEEELEVTFTVTEATDVTAKYVDANGNTVNVQLHNKNKECYVTNALPLSVGSNVLIITAGKTDGTELVKEVVLFRNSEEVSMKNDVIGFLPNSDEEKLEIQKINETILFMNMVEDGDNDNACELIMEQSNPLYQYINDGMIKENEVIYIPPNEDMPTGLTLRYIEMNDISDTCEEYDADTMEVVHGIVPSFAELLEGQGSIASDTLDEENPVAFIDMPKGTEVQMIDDNMKTIQELSAEFSFGNSNTVIKKGWQTQNLKSFYTSHTLRVEDKNIEGSIAFGFKDVIMYDKDGDEDTKNDRIVLDGTIMLDEIQPILGCEWNNQMELPQQLISTIEYTEKANVKATFGAELGSVSEVLESYHVEGYEKNTKLLNDIKLTGVDMSDSLVIGAIGLQYGTGVTVGNIRTVKAVSQFTGFNPIIVITFFLDLDGEIKANVSVEYDYNSYVKKGINIQKQGYEGAFRTCKENMGTENKDILGYQINVYDIKAASKEKQSSKPESTLTIAAEGTATAKAGVGVGLGLMVYGVMPAYAKVGVSAEAEATLKGAVKCKFPFEEKEDGTPSFIDAINVEGNAKASLAINAFAEAGVSLHVIDEEGAIRFDVGFDAVLDPWKYTLAEWIFSTTEVKGRIVDKENGEPIAGAVVKLEKSSTINMGNSKYRSAVTDENGYFKIANCADGIYKITVEKEGYEHFENESLNVDENIAEQQISLGKEIDYTVLFKEYIEEKLIPSYGLAKVSQQGIMYEWDDAWLEPEGILSTQIYDLDNDGYEELLMLRIMDKNTNSLYRLNMSVYEVKNGKVVLSDSTTMDDRITWKGASIFDKNVHISIVCAEGNNYIFCEANSETSAFVDGIDNDYWTMIYEDEKLQYAFAFVQTGGDTIDFEYSGWVYEDNKVVKKEVLWRDWENDASEYGEAISGWFQQYGIDIKENMKSWWGFTGETLLSDSNNQIKIFDYVIQCVGGDSEAGYYKFKATLTDYTKIR